MLGPLTFDPLELSRMSQADRKALLIDRVLGLGKRLEEAKALEMGRYEERRDANAAVKAIEGQLGGIAPPSPNTPDEPVDIRALMADLEREEDLRRQERYRRTEADHETVCAEKLDIQVSRLVDEHARIAQKIDECKRIAADHRKNAEEFHCAANEIAASFRDMDGLKDRIASADEINRSVSAKASYTEVCERLRNAKEVAKRADEAVTAAREARDALLDGAQWPINGMGWDADTDDVTFNGIPFAQCSSGEQIIVSARVAMSCNDKLRTMFVRDASLLDDDSMAALKGVAADSDYQLFVEVVGDGGDGCITIEDGAVKK